MKNGHDFRAVKWYDLKTVRDVEIFYVDIDILVNASNDLCREGDESLLLLRPHY